MSTAFSSGALFCFVGILKAVPRVTSSGVTASYTPAFLGTGKPSPQIERTTAYFRVMNDLAGDQLPYDDGFAGQEAMSMVDLTKFEQSTLDLINSGFPIAGREDGTWTDADLGTLWGTEGWAFPVWYRYGRAGVAAMRDQGMPRGIRYFGSRLVTSTESRGVKENVCHVVFQHRAQRNAQGVWRLKDNDMTAVFNLPTP